MRRRLLWYPLLLLLFAVCSLPKAAGASPVSSGVFVDRLGRQHPWSVTATHALIWDGSPYVPVGGIFTPRSLAQGAGEADWNADLKDLAVLKSQGNLDLLIMPPASMDTTTAAAWQRLVDYLDGQGFRYGIGFGAGITTPITGTVVKPASYRVPDLPEGGRVSWRVERGDAAFFVIADKDGAILKYGRLSIHEGAANFSGDPSIPERAIGLLYPHEAFVPGPAGGWPNLWDGFDGYRDRILQILGNVKFGAGLRFFLDPLAHPMALDADTDYLVPDTPGFRLAWQAYLSRKYASLDDLATAWHLVDRDLKDFGHAAALVPLWSGRRGVPGMLDTTTGSVMQADTNVELSRFWSDFREFRAGEAAWALNGIADVLKQQIADVPVVFTWTSQNPAIGSADRSGGFDGIGVAAYGRGSALVTGGADAAYVQCDQSAKSLWFLVTETAASEDALHSAPYGSQDELVTSLNWLGGIGAKGFFVNGYRVNGAGASSTGLVATPEELQWLRQFAEHIQRGVDITMGRPRILPFPAAAAGIVRAGPIGSGGVWWAPSTLPGKVLDLGSSYAGYTVSLAEGDRTVLWSLRGPRLTHLLVQDPKGVTVAAADGAPIPVKVDARKHLVIVNISDAPVVIASGGEDVFPVEAAEDALKQFAVLVNEATALHVPVDEYRFQLENALRTFRSGPQLALMNAAAGINKLAAMLQPFTWIEAESADPTTFSEVAQNPATSGGAFLLLNSGNPPGPGGYAAQYRFSVPADDTYTVWLCCTPPGGGASPFAWVIDAGEAHASSEAVPVGSRFLLDRLVWLRLGRVSLAKGTHTLTLRVTGRAPGLGKYYLAMDALLVTRFAFTPSGTLKPPVAPIPEGPLPNVRERRPSRRR
ncbi:MAG: hypothetical protein ACP5VE_13840 [Chthonomonadales bacterium]